MSDRLLGEVKHRGRNICANCRYLAKTTRNPRMIPHGELWCYRKRKAVFWYASGGQIGCEEFEFNDKLKYFEISL